MLLAQMASEGKVYSYLIYMILSGYNFLLINESPDYKCIHACIVSMQQLSQNLSSVDISVREKLAELQNQRAAKEKVFDVMIIDVFLFFFLSCTG